MKRLCIICLISVCFYSYSFAQSEQTNAGTDFWITSMIMPRVPPERSAYMDISDLLYGNNIPDTAVVSLVGATACTGYATNPHTGWRVNFTVLPNIVTKIKIPKDVIICNHTAGIQQKGVHLHTDSNVFAYLETNNSNSGVIDNQRGFAQFGSKIQLIPQINYLTDAVVSLFPQTIYETPQRTSIIIIASEDNTLIEIPSYYRQLSISSDTSLIQYVNNESYLLSRGEVLVVPFIVYTPDIENNCFHISTNCKKIAVYQNINAISYNYAELYTNSLMNVNANTYGKHFLFSNYQIGI